MTGLEYYSPWLAWIFPIISSLFVPLVAKFGHKVRDSFVIIAGIITSVLAASMVPGIYSGNLGSPPNIKWIPIVDIKLGVLLDPLSVHEAVEIEFMEHIPYLVAKGVTRFVYGFRKIAEMNILERIPALAAIGSVKLANITLGNFDRALDKLIYLIAQGTALQSLKSKKIHGGALPQFVLAAVPLFMHLATINHLR